MKKFGFTLAELVITLSIIGVVSALMAPAISAILPDKNKIKVINYHVILTNTINDMLSDEKIFKQYTTYNKDTGEASLSCVGVACIEDFQSELEKRLGIENDKRNGLLCRIRGDNTAGYYNMFAVDNRDSKYYEQNTDIKEVNTFVFKIDKYGTVSAGDALTDAYLKNPLNMNDKKADLETAKKFAQEKTYD